MSRATPVLFLSLMILATGAWADGETTPVAAPSPSPTESPVASLPVVERTWLSWYNEGTRLLQEKKVDAAWSYLDAALTLKPWDLQIRNNRKVCDAIETPRPGDSLIERDPAGNWLELLDQSVSLTLLELLALIACSLSVTSSLRRLNRGAFRHVAKPFLTAVLVIAVIETLRIYPGVRPPVWVIQEITLRSGPGNDFQVLAQIKAGTRLRRESASGQWLQLGFAPGRVGWVAADGVLQLPSGTEKTQSP